VEAELPSIAVDRARPLRVDRRADAFVEALGGDLPRLQRIARLLTASAPDADDLVAEAVARALPRWRAGDVDDPAAYLRRTVVNLATSRWRRRRLALARDRAALGWHVEPGDAADELAERDRTLAALRALAPRRRAIVVLRFYDDLPDAAIAELLGVELGTVKSQLSRALGQLRGTLGRQDEV
jgi:RNA polymerase sigma-70 factor (sigma-E family)